MPDPQSKAEMEKAVRGLLRKHARKFSEALLTPECHQLIWSMVQQGILVLQWLHRESRRKKRSKEYQKFVEDMLGGIAEAYLGRLDELTPEQFETLEKLADGIMVGFVGKSPEETIEGKAFLELQEKLFVTPKKRGPKNQQRGDEAFVLHLQGMEVSRIARKLDPDGYEADPVNSIQKISRAIQRRARATRLA